MLLKNKNKIYVDRSSHPFWKTYVTNPPLRYLRNEQYAKFIHKINRFPTRLDKPFIIDVEHILHLSGYSRDYARMIQASAEIEKLISLPQCKAIVGATDGTLKDALKYIQNKDLLRQKFIKVPPAIRVKKAKDYEIIKDEPFTILCIGNKFWVKGTHITIDVFRKLREEFNDGVKLILVCNDVPDDFTLCEGIELITNFQLTSEMRDNLFARAHIFMFPCLADSFGVYLETLAYGLPVIGTNYYDKKEIVLDGITGYLFKTPISLYDGNIGEDYKNFDEFESLIITGYNNGIFIELIENMYKKTRQLVQNQTLLEELSIESQKFCKEQLSIKLRNEKIKKVYNTVFNSLLQ